MRLLGAVFLSIALSMSAIISGPAPALAMRDARAMAGSLLEPALSVASLAPMRWLLGVLGQEHLQSGNDGRVTVLLLGSDARGGGIGRTDTIMVVSIKNQSISAASIPRDAARIPNPWTGGTFRGRVNTILKQLRQGANSDEAAVAKFQDVIAHLLDVEIDYHALITFTGFQALVSNVDSITVSSTLGPIKDAKFWDDPNKQRGVYFPAAQDYTLYAANPDTADGLCNGLWRTRGTSAPYWCRRALPFVRSRKGAGNSDFRRAARQQLFVDAGVARVLERGNGTNLSALVTAALGQSNQSHLTTDIPLDDATALEFYDLLTGSHLDSAVVFKPRKYAKRISGTTAYRLTLSAVRAWTASHME